MRRQSRRWVQGHLDPKKNHPSTEKGYDTDYASTSKTATTRVSLQSPFEGKTLRKTNGSINGDPFHRELNKKS